MKASTFTASLAMLAAVVLPAPVALAQGAGAGGEWRGGEQPAAGGDESIDWDRIFGAGKGAPPADGPAAAAPDAPRERAPVDPDRERRISRNRRSAIETYEGILNNEDGELEGLETRLANNRRLIAKHRAALDEATGKRRFLQMDFLNRTLQLKKQRDDGKLTPPLFATLVEKEEDSYAVKIADLEDDIQFHQAELDSAVARTSDIGGQTDLIKASRVRGIRAREFAGPGGKKAAPKPLHERLVGDMRSSLRRVSKFRVRNTMDGVSSFDVPVAGPIPAPMEGDEDDDDDDDDEDDD